jgi:NADH:ubiquinone oxidoreductase subunit 2 (subunit N)
MLTGIKHLHSFLPYLLLPILFLALVVALSGFNGKRPFKGFTKVIALLGLMFSHIMLVAGLVLYIAQERYKNIGASMKIAEARLFAVEHISVMIIGIVLITMGYSKAKRKESAASAHKTIFWFYAAGLILILSRIPWAQWLG